MSEYFHLLRNTILRLVDYTYRLVSGDLTDDGIQYSDVVNTTTKNTDVEVLNVTVEPKVKGTIQWVEFGLTALFKALFSGFNTWQASTAYNVGDIVVPTSYNGHYYECTTAGTSDSSEPTWPTTDGNTVTDNTVVWTCRGISETFKWQARNKGGTWVDLHTAVTISDIGNSYQEKTMSGYFTPETNFNQVPFDLRLIYQCSYANQGAAKVKNSSYVRVVYAQ